MTPSLRAALRALAAALPPETAVPVPAGQLLGLLDGDAGQPAHSLPVQPSHSTWRERLWTCPPDTRLGVREVAEALGRTRSAVYRLVANKRGPHRLPAARLAGQLVFEAGVVRAWLVRETAHA